MSKAVGGSLPLAVLGIKRKFDAWQPAGHTGTFRGNQLAMGTGLATIQTIKEQNLAQNAQERGDFLQAEIKKLAAEFPCIGNVRGRGLFQALELVSSREQKTPLTAADMAAIKGALTEAGLLAFVVENRIHVVPPCTISAEQIAKGLAIFDSVFARFAMLAK